MFVLIAIAAGVLTNFLANAFTEFAKPYIANILDNDEEIKDLLKTLEEKLNNPELEKNVNVIDRICSGSPPDWIDQLDDCLYEFEDKKSSNLTDKKKTVVKFLTNYINYVDLIRTGAEHEAQITDAGGDSNRQDHDCSSYQLWSSSEKQKSKIIEELTCPTSPFGVSIIGMGGMGKTILATDIACDVSSRNYFHIISIPPQSSKFNRVSVLDYIKCTHVVSKDKRALILLDGVRWVNPEDWVEFSYQCKTILHPESKVLITTQNPRVADDTGTSKHCMPPLLGEECFSYIYNYAKAYSNLDEKDDHAMRHNKKELVDLCRGSPLLASQLGSLLAAQPPGNRLDMIREIAQKSSWEVEGLKRVLVNLELVSLLTQKPNLVRCLAYCSLFPPDHEFEQGDLVQFWMAEGFTPPSTNPTWLERITKGYFDDLHSFSLFQSSASLPGQLPRYKLNRLFYDMALNVASSKFCLRHMGNPNSPEISTHTRHLSLRCEDGKKVNVENLFTDLQKLCSGLRTFLLFRQSGEKIEKNPTFFHSLTFLRVLDLRYTNLSKLSFIKLKYLRYLDLSHTPVVELPKLSKCSELQVLKLKDCEKLLKLPTSLTKLTNLISLRVNAQRLACLPSGIRNLINLQRLDVFIVGVKKGFKIKELKSLNGLRKTLCIRKLENVKTKKQAEKAMLKEKGKLERLELVWSSSEQNISAVQVLKGLEPPKNLTELMIINYYGAEFPGWLNDRLVCGLLESIHLQGCKALPSIDQLELLKTLRLEAMHPIDHPTNQNFPVLETLVLCDMEKLDQWIEFAANSMPSLLNLQIEKCQKLVILPPLRGLNSLKKLEISWCTMLEQLPTLPQSLNSLTITESDNLKQLYQTGGANHPTIRGIHVVIDSTPVDTSEPVAPTRGH